MADKVSAKAGKLRRLRCGHCDELLSHRVYKRHKKDYYDTAERRWIRRAIDSSSEGSDPEQDFETDVPFAESDTDQGMLLASRRSLS